MADESARTRTISWLDPAASAGKGLEMSGLDYIGAIRDGEVPRPRSRS